MCESGTASHRAGIKYMPKRCIYVTEVIAELLVSIVARHEATNASIIEQWGPIDSIRSSDLTRQDAPLKL